MLLCAFAGVLPAVAATRLWDLLFLDGPGVAFAVCLALLQTQAAGLCRLTSAVRPHGSFSQSAAIMASMIN